MTEIERRLEKIYSQTTKTERAEIDRAAKLIKEGKLVAFPTETVYGLGANALDADAVRKIYEAKGRPSDNPLILHVASVEMAEKIVELNGAARALIEKVWPGPLTLVLPAKEIVPLTTRGGLETAAVRMPDNRTALELIRAANLPISAPSANKSGRPSPTDAQTVREDLGDAVAQVLDGGATKIGVESTVIDMTQGNPILLRAGGLPKEEIEEILGTEVLLPQDKNTAKRSPGTRYRHYAPKIPLLLAKAKDAEKLAEGKKFAWMGTSKSSGKPIETLVFENETEYAHEVFRALRRLENSGAEIIIAETPPEKGIGLAIKDRLNRASGD
ncbi:MAG: L-threonylcarbamoyladenylate synthase [Synergistaceae bacterium]|nr:L-threonylcarbamoyladenylate synthase [Synergistaceae bacterium]